MSVTTGHPRRQHPPGRLALPARPAVVAAATLLALAAPAVASAAPVVPAGNAPESSTAAGSILTGAAALNQDGTARTVRLITGQQVRLIRGTGGRYTVAPDEASMAPVAQSERAQLIVHGEIDPGSSNSTISAMPTYARGLVASGAVDPRLFDITYLAEHGYATGTVPVVVRYTSARSTAAVAKDAAALPASTYIAGTATAHQATVAVTPDAAGTFWSAITHTPPADPTTVKGKVWYHNPNAPRVLRDGIGGLVLAGSSLTSKPAAAPGLTLPSYQLTVRLHGFTDPNRWAMRNTVMYYVNAGMYGLAGAVAGSAKSPSSVVCNQAKTCDTLTITYHVPAGTYQLDVEALATHDFKFAPIRYVQPSIDIDSNRALDLRADDATYPTLSTPRPNQIFESTTSINYGLADGRHEFNLWFDWGPWSSLAYLIPEKKPVSVGTFSFALSLVAGTPPISGSASTAGHPAIALTPTYPNAFDYGQRAPSLGVGPVAYSFPAGTHPYPIAYIGYGTAGDIANRDLTGKVALMRLDPANHCTVDPDTLRNAMQAHAVGVLFDLTNPDSDNTGGCYPTLRYDGTKQVDPTPTIPWASILATQAQQLEDFLTKGPVTVDMTASDTQDDLYLVASNHERTTPASLARTLTAKDVATDTTTVHPLQSTSPEYPLMWLTAFQPQSFGIGGTEYWDWRASAPYQANVHVATTPDTNIGEEWRSCRIGDGGGPCDITYDQLRNWTPATPTTSTAHYGRAPFAIGSIEVPPGLVTSSFADLCVLCRQGDDLVLYFDVVSGAAPDTQTRMGQPATTLTNGTFQLSANGVPIQPGGLFGAYSYTLPAGPAKYQLTAHVDSADYSWAFTSSAPTKDATPNGKACAGTAFGLSTDLCAPAPLVFVRYVAPVDALNQAPSDTQQTLMVTAYEEGDHTAAIAGLTQEVSFDHGKTWNMVRVIPTGTPGTYSVMFKVPKLAQTNGYVSLRTTARDAAGNSTTQTYYDSYALK
jgi:hypothetical protein